MTLDEVFTLLQAIRQCQAALSDNPPIKFSYCLARNAKLLDAEITSAQDIINQDIDMEMLQAYERRRQELLMQYAKKDDDGNPVIVDDQYQLSPSEVQRIQHTLLDQFPKAQDAFTQRARRTMELGGQEVTDLTLYKLDLALWPDVPAQMMNDLMVLVED